MNKKKSLYEAPTTETFVVRFEGNIMSPTGESFGTQTGSDDDSDWD